MQTALDKTAALTRYFGFDGFLDNQEEIVDRVLSGRDVCVIMPTGAGKSLCYQLPILMRPGYGIVVSPLISLMKDQVDALTARGIAAACINSTVSFFEQTVITDAVKRGEIKLLYVAPERFHTDYFRGFLHESPPEVMIIDEAHCISQWGHDFRPSYFKLGEVIATYRFPQVCAFTATATPLVRDDIRTRLARPEMELCVAGFKRPNLAFSVMRCSSDESKFTALRSLLKESRPTIIYASTRKAVEQLVEKLGCIGYHAGMSDADREEAQNRFMNDPCPVLAATNAFGMGIDRPDVRRVVHFNLPGSLEAYYQEAGRAGRDGEAAECVLLYAWRDRYIQEFLIDLGNPTPELVQELYTRLLQIGRERNTAMLEVTLSELVGEVPGAKSDSQLSAAMAILEKAGLVDRGFRRSNRGFLRFTGNLAELAELHAAETTQRSRFIARCIAAKGAALLQSNPYTLEELAALSGLSPEQAKRVLRALDGECLEWSVPFSGRGTELLHPDKVQVDMDYTAMSSKRQFEMDRLEKVCQYADAASCRQAALIQYFGEQTDNWSCGSCDNCNQTTHNAALREICDAAEAGIVDCILQAADHFDGKYGAGKLSQILAGGKSAELAGWGLHHDRFFGRLDNLKQNKIMAYLKALEHGGYLGRVERNGFPCLEITARGLEVKNGHAKARIDIAPPPRTASSGRSASGGRSSGSRSSSAFPNRRLSGPVELGDDAATLYETLRKLRQRMAEGRGAPAYTILSNTALTELAERQPITVEESKTISGIGEVKAASVIPPFLEVIREWRKRR